MMKIMLRKSALAATALVAGFGLVLTSAGSAEAASHVLSSCSGTKKYDKTRTDGSGSLRLRIYYSSSHGGRTCATAYKGGSLSGHSSYVRVSIGFSNYDGTSWPKYDNDEGNYKTFAGAVYLDNSSGDDVDVDAVYEPAGGGTEKTLYKYNYDAS